MNENNLMESSAELDQMRQAMGCLREQLSRQQIVNEKLLRQVLIGKSGFVIGLTNIQLYVVVPLCSLFFVALAAAGMVSWFFAIFTVVLLCFSGLLDKLYYVGKKDLATLPMVDIAAKVSRQKHREPLKMALETAVMVPWCIWFFMDYFSSSDIHKGIVWFSIGFAVVTTIVILIYFFIRLRNSQNEILSSVDRFLSETRGN